MKRNSLVVYPPCSGMRQQPSSTSNCSSQCSEFSYGKKQPVNPYLSPSSLKQASPVLRKAGNSYYHQRNSSAFRPGKYQGRDVKNGQKVSNSCLEWRRSKQNSMDLSCSLSKQFDGSINLLNGNNTGGNCASIASPIQISLTQTPLKEFNGNREKKNPIKVQSEADKSSNFQSRELYMKCKENRSSMDSCYGNVLQSYSGFISRSPQCVANQDSIKHPQSAQIRSSSQSENQQVQPLQFQQSFITGGIVSTPSARMNPSEEDNPSNYDQKQSNKKNLNEEVEAYKKELKEFQSQLASYQEELRESRASNNISNQESKRSISIENGQNGYGTARESEGSLYSVQRQSLGNRESIDSSQSRTRRDSTDIYSQISQNNNNQQQLIGSGVKSANIDLKESAKEESNFQSDSKKKVMRVVTLDLFPEKVGEQYLSLQSQPQQINPQYQQQQQQYSSQPQQQQEQFTIEQQLKASSKTLEQKTANKNLNNNNQSLKLQKEENGNSKRSFHIEIDKIYLPSNHKQANAFNSLEINHPPQPRYSQSLCSTARENDSYVLLSQRQAVTFNKMKELEERCRQVQEVSRKYLNLDNLVIQKPQKQEQVNVPSQNSQKDKKNKEQTCNNSNNNSNNSSTHFAECAVKNRNHATISLFNENGNQKLNQSKQIPQNDIKVDVTETPKFKRRDGEEYFQSAHQILLLSKSDKKECMNLSSTEETLQDIDDEKEAKESHLCFKYLLPDVAVFAL